MALKPLNSVAGFSVGETPSNVISGNGDITTNNFTTTGVANLNSISNVKISGGSNAQVIQTDGAGNLSFVTIDTWRIQNGNSNVQALANSNVTVTVAGNANIAVFTSTGVDVNGYLTVNGNVTANGNLSANNYLVTPSTKDLIIAPATQLTRIYSNVNPFSTTTYDLGNSLARWNNVYANYANLSGTISVTGNAAVGGLLTDNLYYANGTPWDLQEAAGSNTQIQFNNNNNFGASANFTFDTSTNLLTVTGNTSITGNANIGNIGTGGLITATGNVTGGNLVTGGAVSATGNANVGNLGTTGVFATTLSSTGNANVGNLGTAGLITATGNITGSNVVGSNVYVTSLGNGQLAIGYTGGQLVGGPDLFWEFSNAALFTTALKSNGYITASGNITGGNLVTGGLVSATGNLSGANISASGFVTATGNITGANLVTSGVISATGNANIGNIGTGGLITATGNINSSAFVNAANLSVTGNANIGNIGTGGLITATGNITGGNLTTGGALSVTGNANIGNIGTGGLITATGNITGGNLVTGGVVSAVGNANVGNIGATNGVFSGNVTVTGDIANANNISVTNALNAVTGNFSGNITSLNANLGNLATANFVNVSSNINVTGNVNAGNLVGPLANGNSNVRIFSNANVEISIGGTANIASFSGNSLFVVGNVNTTSGGMLANGNVTANGFVNGANANISGEALLGSVKTANITGNGGAITISAAGSDQNINIIPTGNGTVDVGNFRITQVGDPIAPHDATTKEYVDNIAQGLSVHPAVRVTSTTNLNATYTAGGTTQTTTTISGGKTITFSANHGLSVGDEIYWTSSFNGITANNSYFVYSVPALNQITVKDGFNGVEVTTLTNGTGLSQPSRANSGVGATLTNAGANAAISIDSVALSLNDRVLVQGQTSGAQNGIYVVSTVGSGAAAWVLTRSTNEDTYDPKSTTGLGYGDYFFVQQGTNSAGSSYILTTPTGEIIFGVTSLGFTQFSASGSYTAGSGINITGTIISANVDGVTTDIVGGNIVVKTGAQLTTPNIGAATGTSLSVTGNINANNLSISNLANVDGNLTVGGNLFANYSISSNANVSATNFTASGNVNASANVVAANVTANSTVFASNANVSGTTITNALTVNTAITGNTANFSGNIVANNVTVNLALSGNTANFSGNVIVPNLTVNTALAGNTANFSGNVIVPNLTVNTNIAGNTANFSGNISAANANLGNLATANFFTGTLVNGTSNAGINGSGGNFLVSVGGTANVLNINTGGANVTGNLGVSGNFNVGSLVATNVTANTAVLIGNTTITWASVTTSSVTANQTIASLSTTGVTGLEFLVKAVDSSGSKYSVATVQAVTDGTNVDYATFGTVQLGGYTGSLAVNVVGGFVRLQVTPASSNSTVWTTQARTI